MISQVYGGGGNAGAPYNADFVELFNRGTSAVSLSGKSIQYASSTGTTWQKYDLPAISLPAGKYALFQISATGANGVALPTRDGTASPAIAMAAAAGKVALVAGTTALSGSCPTGLIDFVGYGGANCSETAVTSAPSATLSVLRAGNGCTDTDNNSADFSTGSPNPRNTSTTANACSITLSVDNVSAAETNSGTTTISFTVSLSSASTSNTTFTIQTADDSATTADNDYVAKTASGTILAGNLTDTFVVTVNGDTTVESNEEFFVNVSSISGANVTSTSAQGIGTITNDDAALLGLSIGDASVTEGDSGTVTAQFTVSLSNPAPAGGVTFDIATANGTATTADADYVARSLTSQTISQGMSTYTFDVTVNGDTTFEANQNFFVNLTNATGAGLSVTDGQGEGIILNDDPQPVNLSINDVSVAEGSSGTITATFTVSLSIPAPTGGITFDIATADDGATTADNDYVGKALSSQTIAAGLSTYSFAVTVNGDPTVESNEKFFVNVTNVSGTGATITDGQGEGLIRNDDKQPETLPLVQNWSTASLIATNDDWTLVPGIQGFLGQDVTTATGVDPQTLLKSSTLANDPDVIANQANPNTQTSGGVAEFAITDPTIALQGSATADAPNIVLHLNTTGFGTINVAYNLRDIDGSADNAIQPVAVQYRVGNTGDFINLPAGFVADATTGPSLATLVTPVSVTLPAAADNKPEVQVRIITANASGSDEWVGVDDINVTGGPVPLALSINDVSVAEGNTGTSMATFTVSLSVPAPPGGVSFDIATANGTATTVDADYVGASASLVIPESATDVTFAVVINGDTVPEPNQTFYVNVTNAVGTDLVGTGDYQGLGAIVNDDVTRIHDIQGPGATSPFVGQTVTVSGIVTGVKSNGFFIQEADATVDANASTSEGVLVFTSTAPTADATIGNEVQVTGTVQEFTPSSDPLQPPVTEIGGGPTVSVLSTGNTLPDPYFLTTMFPSPSGAFDQLEILEGMRVAVASMTVVAPTGGFVDEPNAGAGTDGVFSGVVTGVARPFREPGIQAPDPATPPIPVFDTNPEVIRVDSDSQTGTSAINVSSDALVTNLVGVLDYSFRRYTILPELATLPGVSGGKVATAVAVAAAHEVTVASYNMERFFDDQAADADVTLTTVAYQKRLGKASKAIRNFLKTPDVIGIQEMENLPTLQALAARISSDAIAEGQPDPLYVGYLTEGNDVGGIDVGFLVKTAEVTAGVPRIAVNSVTQVGKTATYTNPNSSTSLLNDRPPLVLDAVVHHFTGNTFPLTVIVNHLRSLGGVESTAPGSNGFATEGERVRAKRQYQADYLANLIQTYQAENLVVLGDFNAFAFNDGYGDSIGTIKGVPSPDNETLVTGDGTSPVTPALTEIEASDPNENYSYVFGGNAQTLDHVLVDSALVAATTSRRLEHARINADFMSLARNNTDALRLSDHDPAVLFFSVPAFVTTPPTVTSLSATPAYITAAVAADVTSAGTSTIVERGFAYSTTDTTPEPGESGVSTMTVSGDTGVMNATLSGLSSATTYYLQAYARSDHGTGFTGPGTFTTLTCPAITLAALPNAVLGAYSAAATASGGSGSYSYDLTSGSLPLGLSLNPGTGALAGTTSAAGNFTFTITATDANGCAGSESYGVAIGSLVGPGDLLIAEFRLRGPAGALDEYIEVFNRTAGPVTIVAPDGSLGYGIVSESSGLIATITNGTTIPAGGAYLAANSTPSTGYSLSDYGGTGAAAHDASWTVDVADNSGLGLFRSATMFDMAGRVDAVGFTGSSALYKEGAGLAPSTGITSSGQWVFARRTPRSLGGAVQDTGDNTSDFRFVSTTAGIFNAPGVQSALGSPGPRNLSSTRSVALLAALADPLVSANAAPNRIQSGNYHYFRRKITNNTGAPITKLRFRVADLSTLFGDGYSPGVQADWRGIATPSIGILVPGSVTARGLTLEAPSVAYSATGKGAGYNASFTVDLSDLPSAELANGESIYVNLGFRNVKGGSFFFLLVPEVLN